MQTLGKTHGFAFFMLHCLLSPQAVYYKAEGVFGGYQSIKLADYLRGSSDVHVNSQNLVLVPDPFRTWHRYACNFPVRLHHLITKAWA